VKWSKKHIILYGALVLSVICYGVLAFHTVRTNHIELFLLIGVLFGCYILIYKFSDLLTSLRFWFRSAIIIRCIFLFSTPQLSDDYHRFIWDGNVLVQGYNPYEFVPLDIPRDMEVDDYDFILISEMNSKVYYSVYPPLLQVIFASTTYASGDNIAVNVMLLKLFILLFEAISLLLIYRLLVYLRLPPNKWLLYAFNPLIVIELVGNLHFEGIMITGLLATFYLLMQDRFKLAVIPFVIAVGVKLLPLIILPLLWVKLGWRKGFVFVTLVGIGTILLFVPFINTEIINNFSTSLNLYFQAFEFNASIYYLFRWIGFQWSGYNMIDTIGVINALITLGFILFVSFRKQTNWEQTFLQVVLIFGIYLTLASIVHPWYITTLLAFTIFTKYRFALVWSGVIYLSYYTYKDETYTENMWLVLVEYAVVIGYLIYEVWLNKKSAPSVTNHALEK
jgi:hypothetical protein